ncbi:MAG: type II and III secretion system protein family protein, partial [Hyphomicrobiaceae bacterium]
VVISNPEMVDAVVQASNRVYLIAKKTGQANAFFFDASGERVLTLEITVDIDSAPLQQMLKRLIPDSDIKVEMINATVVLSGTVLRPADATKARNIATRFVVPNGGEADKVDKFKVVNLISVIGKEQVMLKVTIAELERSSIKRLGVNWNGAAFGSSKFGFTTDNEFPISGGSGVSSFALGLAGTDAGSCASSLGSPGGGTFVPSLAGPIAAGLTCLGKRLEAFERSGVLRTLAEPTLVAISGETASFLAGGEFPIPVAQDNGTLTIEFKPFGVGLSFTPFVASSQRISLKINTEVSELSDDGAISVGFVSVRGLKVRRASTTVELPSGGSMVLAGLISDDTRQNIDGFPGLKKLPILGSLFRSRDFTKKETELVVIVTPYIVKPVARSAVARPDDNWLPASDNKANFLGHMNRFYGREEEVPEGDYKGDIGFIIE